jgi:hypothetical protein
MVGHNPRDPHLSVAREVCRPVLFCLKPAPVGVELLFCRLKPVPASQLGLGCLQAQGGALVVEKEKSSLSEGLSETNLT